MLTLLIDNYDSFTYNLFQLLAEENGREPIVVRNDEASWEELARLGFDNVVLSPGPGRPERPRDFGVCTEAIRRCEVPLLGVCLGHQGLGWVHGGRVVAAPEPMHGRVRAVEHAGSPLFAGIPPRFDATRYHSLCLERPLPTDLEEIAWADDGVVMAVAHRHRPQWGVQFHPESIATEHGRQLLANFRDLTERPSQAGRGGFVPHSDIKPPRPARIDGSLELKTRRVAGADPEHAFAALYGESPSSFWLDSSLVGKGRFSFMGDASGPLGATISYDVDAHEVTVKRGGETEILDESIFDYLERELMRLRPSVAELDAADLPFEFDCGFAGYLGYEVKADCGSPNTHGSPFPDAAFIFADRLLAFDHELGYTYLLCLCQLGTEATAEAWLSATAASLSTLGPSAAMEPGGGGAAGAPPPSPAATRVVPRQSIQGQIMPDPNRSPRPAATAFVHWPIVALAAVPCLLFVGAVIALLAMMPNPKSPAARPAPALPDPAAVAPAPAADEFASAEITIPAHHAVAALSDLPLFDAPEPAAPPAPGAEPPIVPVPPKNDIVPVKPEKEKDGCFGTAVNFLASPAEAFTAAKKEKRLTLILHVSGNFEDSGFT
jgi:anthranilate synthase/aminodeoxychorismate synthase-like glutamine amidotransferase